MAVLDQFVAYYAFVFHPITVLGAGILALIYEEWADQGLDRSALARRAAAFLGAGVLALVPTAAYLLLRGGLQTALEGSSWRMDLLVAGGVFVATVVTLHLYYRGGERRSRRPSPTSTP
jgi:quinol-cytochrome oxidoreductase complex cytochrome b subunit